MPGQTVCTAVPERMAPRIIRGTVRPKAMQPEPAIQITRPMGTTSLPAARLRGANRNPPTMLPTVYTASSIPATTEPPMFSLAQMEDMFSNTG